MPGTINGHKQLGKGNDYREFSGKLGVVASTAYDKVNTTCTDENLLRLLPVPGYGAKISARAPTKGYVQTLNRALVCSHRRRIPRGPYFMT